MSVFVYLDQNQTPTGVQRFETMPGVDITVPPGVLYFEDASELPNDMDIINHWRIKSGVLTDVGPNPGPSYRWDTNSESWIPDIPKAKENKLQQLKATRDQKESGGFVWDGSVFDSDPLSQLRIQGSVALAQVAFASNTPFTIEWTLKNNSIRSLSGQDMIQVGLSLANHIITIHQTYRDLKEQLSNATTLQVIDNILWP